MLCVLAATERTNSQHALRQLTMTACLLACTCLLSSHPRSAAWTLLITHALLCYLQVEVLCGSKPGLMTLSEATAPGTARGQRQEPGLTISCRCSECVGKPPVAYTGGTWERHAGLGQSKKWRSTIRIVNGLQVRFVAGVSLQEAEYVIQCALDVHTCTPVCMCARLSGMIREWICALLCCLHMACRCCVLCQHRLGYIVTVPPCVMFGKRFAALAWHLQPACMTAAWPL